MGKFDLKGAQSRASTPSYAQMRPGAVYRILDDTVNWPESRNKPRGHKHRRVIVLQDDELCRPNAGPLTVMVIPCSSSGCGGAAAWDFLLPEEEEGFDKSRVVAYVSLVQPVLKADLIEHLGYVSKGTLGELKARAQRVLAIQRSPAKLPGRERIGSIADSAPQAPAPSMPTTGESITSAALFSVSKNDPPE